MRLSRQSAEMIVKEINAIIHNKINMMNDRGIIIASSDPERIGEVHQGARRILQEGLQELIVCKDNAYGTMKEGVNYPICIYEDIVGVVGITGACEKVQEYGLITKKMTEILLKETYIREKELLDAGVRNRFIAEWLHSENIGYDKDFVERGRRMNIDITIPRRFMVLSITHSGNRYNAEDEMHITEECEKRIGLMLDRNEISAICFKSVSELIVGITNRTDSEMRLVAGKILQITKQIDCAEIKIGIDDTCYIYSRVYISYYRARRALQSCGHFGRGSICFYHELNVELFVDEIAESTKNEYIKKLFPDSTFEEIVEIMDMLEVVYATQGSIRAAAEQMHIHKNTLQYKLRKLKEKTGYDPRLLGETPLFYLALCFFRGIKEDKRIAI